MEEINQVVKDNKKMIEELFISGFQYGHKSIKSSPKMKRYIHSIKWGISIIDLCQTAMLLKQALDYLFNVVSKGGSVLFVGTKYQARDLVKKYATECNQFYINKRWLGGSLTNYANTLLKKVEKLQEIEKNRDLGIIANYSKKEQLKISENERKINELIEGVRNMLDLPDLLIVIDAKREEKALKEAKKFNIPAIVLADTDTPDPQILSYIVPGNDDGVSSIDLFLNKCKDTILFALDAQNSLKNEKNPNKSFNLNKESKIEGEVV